MIIILSKNQFHPIFRIEKANFKHIAGKRITSIVRLWTCRNNLQSRVQNHPGINSKVIE